MKIIEVVEEVDSQTLVRHKTSDKKITICNKKILPDKWIFDFQGLVPSTVCLDGCFAEATATFHAKNVEIIEEPARGVLI